MTKEEKKERDRQYYLKNKDKICAKVKEYRDNNKEVISVKKKKYNEDNKEKLAEYQKNYRIENSDKLKEFDKKRYTEERKEKSKKYHTSEKGKAKRRSTRKKNIGDTWRSLLHSSLKRLGKSKDGHTIDLLGYSAIELKEHLSKLFTDGMTWENHGEWHIDHIRPVSSFNEDTSSLVVNALSNLQPLWANDNLIKSNNII